jgi:hypothetical protein
LQRTGDAETEAPTVAPTPSPAAETNESDGDSSNSFSTGAIAGIAAGGALVAVMVAVLAVLRSQKTHGGHDGKTQVTEGTPKDSPVVDEEEPTEYSESAHVHLISQEPPVAGGNTQDGPGFKDQTRTCYAVALPTVDAEPIDEFRE